MQYRKESLWLNGECHQEKTHFMRTVLFVWPGFWVFEHICTSLWASLAPTNFQMTGESKLVLSPQCGLTAKQFSR